MQMHRSQKNILITGLPGVGKTTAIVRLAEAFKDFHPAGFFTREMRERGVRQGFELTSFDGRTAILSHVQTKSPYHVGKYGVDIPGFESFLETIKIADSETRLIVIDEIGKMECNSVYFKALVRNLLDSSIPVIATIAQKDGGFIAEIKDRVDARLYVLTAGNRDLLTEEIQNYARSLLAP